LGEIQADIGPSPVNFRKIPLVHAITLAKPVPVKTGSRGPDKFKQWNSGFRLNGSRSIEPD
jgi:hypothetical protein